MSFGLGFSFRRWCIHQLYLANELDEVRAKLQESEDPDYRYSWVSYVSPTVSSIKGKTSD